LEKNGWLLANNSAAKIEPRGYAMGSTFVDMDLISSLSPFQMLASIPLLMMLVPLILDVYKSLLANPIVSAAVNTTLVVLKNTELVWRPALHFAVMILKPMLNALVLVFPQVKAVMRIVFNQTMALLQFAQSMGISLMNGFSNMMERFGEVGDALIVVARGFGHVGYYTLRATGAVVGSFESIFVFGKRMLFEAHLLTVEDLSNVMMPFFTVLAVLATLYWFRKGSSGKTVEAFQPRRSPRIARKRAMLYGADASDALSPCKKSSTTSSNL
jgi:hypothetical protein